MSRQVLSIPIEDAYYDRPIRLRNPIVFYEGHLPAFNINTLMKLAMKCRGIDEHYETLFARGIDPDSVDAMKAPTEVWPSRAEVQAYGERADGIIEEPRACNYDVNVIFAEMREDLELTAEGVQKRILARDLPELKLPTRSLGNV